MEEKDELNCERKCDSLYKKCWDSNWKVESLPALTIKRVKFGMHEMRCYLNL